MFLSSLIHSPSTVAVSSIFMLSSFTFHLRPTITFLYLLDTARNGNIDNGNDDNRSTNQDYRPTENAIRLRINSIVSFLLFFVAKSKCNIRDITKSGKSVRTKLNGNSIVTVFPRYNVYFIVNYLSKE